LENPLTIEGYGLQGQDLKDFRHPANAIYLVGADFGGFHTEAPGAGETIVYLPVSDLWAEGVLNIVLYDRMIKST
jgi:hypothetical protein